MIEHVKYGGNLLFIELIPSNVEYLIESCFEPLKTSAFEERIVETGNEIKFATRTPGRFVSSISKERTIVRSAANQRSLANRATLGSPSRAEFLKSAQ